MACDTACSKRPPAENSISERLPIVLCSTYYPTPAEPRTIMNRLRRFFEKLPYGIKSSRAAYVIKISSLPEAMPDAEWTEDATFSAAEAVLSDPQLKSVYKTALEKGCAIVKTSQQPGPVPRG